MEIELIEIRDFIAQHPPFDVLSDEALNNLPKYLTIRYFRQGSTFPDLTLENKSLYIVRSGAIDIRNQHAQLIDKLAEGDLYLLDENSNKLKGICVEDTLVYLLGYEKLELLKNQSDEFSRQFNQSIDERLRHAVKLTQTDDMRDLSAMKLEVNALTVRPPVIVDVLTTIQEAAI